ncbi:hypothetical protein [Pseudalkalibacillus decolorationis]|uniref:hypothetical protein n=1 Tax=Pseudalkalibacillus decolorationis TaxID=163879 RepID=UPI0021472874|nr:hypothetical protein [Pseudalkalibacillus decolorationis]
MEDKLKNLDKIMEKAVYQKKRFSEERKDRVMKQIRKQDRPSRFEKFIWVLKPVLSLTVCLFLLIFSVNFILQPPKEQTADHEIKREAVASLPLLNRISHIAKRDNQIIHQVSISKRDHYLFLSIQVKPSANESNIRTTIEGMFRRGSELYLDKEMESIDEIGAPWGDYTVDITVFENLDQKGIWEWEEEGTYLFRGVKPKDQDFITWLDKEKHSNN